MYIKNTVLVFQNYVEIAVLLLLNVLKADPVLSNCTPRKLSRLQLTLSRKAVFVIFGCIMGRLCELFVTVR